MQIPLIEFFINGICLKREKKVHLKLNRKILWENRLNDQHISSFSQESRRLQNHLRSIDQPRRKIHDLFGQFGDLESFFCVPLMGQPQCIQLCTQWFTHLAQINGDWRYRWSMCWECLEICLQISAWEFWIEHFCIHFAIIQDFFSDFFHGFFFFLWFSLRFLQRFCSFFASVFVHLRWWFSSSLNISTS